jgi:hypothetical protein
MLRLAAQVQARTQQLTAEGGQRKQLLVRTHDPNLAAGGGETQGCLYVAGAAARFEIIPSKIPAPSRVPLRRTPRSADSTALAWRYIAGARRPM